MHQLEVIRLVLPRVYQLGPAALRRKLLELIPFGPVQRMIKISDALHTTSLEIYHEKKAALEKGDEAMKQHVGEGKDIMSDLRESLGFGSNTESFPSSTTSTLFQYARTW